nr:LysR family transcriptional regulator [uncultured Rhodoferax sp.]
MEIRRLKHLVALADTRNFGRAAQQCHLSQPAFSRSIQAAEDELGLQLFDRGTTEVRCTDAGTFVVERARKLVFDNHCLERDVSLYRERQMGDIALGVGPYPAATLLPVLLTDMRTRFPAVHVRVEVNNANYLAEHLRAEELDFYVADLRNIPATSDLAVTRIGQLTAGLYVRKGHPLLKSASVLGEALLPYGIASVRVPEKILFLMASLMGLPEGVRLPLAIECDDLNLLKTVAMATDTVVACADAGAREEVADGRLVRLTTPDLPTQFSDVGVVSLKGRSFSPMAQYAVDFLTQLGLEQVRP